MAQFEEFNIDQGTDVTIIYYNKITREGGNHLALALCYSHKPIH